MEIVCWKLCWYYVLLYSIKLLLFFWSNIQYSMLDFLNETLFDINGTIIIYRQQQR